MPDEGGTRPDEGGTNGGTQEEQPELARYSVPAAARIIGISERGVRRRIEAGTLAAERDGSRWAVLLPAAPGGTVEEQGGTEPEQDAEAGGTAEELARLYREQQERIDRLQHERAEAMQQAAYYQGQLEELREHLRLLTDSRAEENTEGRSWWRRLTGR